MGNEFLLSIRISTLSFKLGSSGVQISARQPAVLKYFELFLDPTRRIPEKLLN
jgi:hypothetical protein